MYCNCKNTRVKYCDDRKEVRGKLKSTPRAGILSAKKRKVRYHVLSVVHVLCEHVVTVSVDVVAVLVAVVGREVGAQAALETCHHRPTCTESHHNRR